MSGNVCLQRTCTALACTLMMERGLPNPSKLVCDNDGIPLPFKSQLSVDGMKLFSGQHGP